ncbi:hypothetical protein [Cognatishimia maritima]|uniref:4Fe-4S ferredoxin-type domain-containing protein n=1 Tax=Cognatishimia maritima TaxID=870908 RepID=A0A1M5MJV8_9RHOB|nr:hypothetical protein [Cognatishimia maritima]SHG77650.1 hypothetical protein SAMN04488044_1257 [Cognatishimia maritima]
MIEDALKAAGLTIFGGFHPHQDPWFDDYLTALLIGPDEPRFWHHFTQQHEYRDGLPDAMDRYSKRVLNVIAAEHNGKALYPSDGPPYPPFIQWALSSGCAQSPVGLLVSDKAGLFASFRGILALPNPLDLPIATHSPCATCTEQPCRTACPIGALTPAGYDVAACKAYLRTEAGQPCLSGCKVRLSCPASQKFGRLQAQSRFHMKAFLGE